MLAQSKILATRDKFASGSGFKNENMFSKELAEGLHKKIIRKFFLKKEVYTHLYRQYLGRISCRYAIDTIDK